MSAPLLLGIDEGTTAVKAALFDEQLNRFAASRREIPVARPRPGWVEQDAELILDAVIDAVAELLEHAGGREVIAAGLDHQGESVLAWEAGGRSITPVVVWQDKRQQTLLDAIDPATVARSRLPLDPYFSAGKLAWLLANDPAVQRARDRGTLRLGTVDAYLGERLGGRFATDLTTASRTQLLAAGGRDWDQQLLQVFGIQREWLPQIGSTFGSLGELRHERWNRPLALCAQLVDQQAALAGSGAVATGELKASYGTGVFVLGRSEHIANAGALLPTVAWAAPDPAGGVGEVAGALDGGVFAAGSLLEWLAHGLGLAPDAASLIAAAGEVPDSTGVRVLPALAGLGAPWWRPDAHGVLAGLHGGVGAAHVAHAALQAIAWRVADIVEAFAELAPVERLLVDGGLTASPTLLALQADAAGVPVSAGASETTVLGAALLAGVGAGVFSSVADGAARLQPPRAVIAPRLSDSERARRRARWREFVQAAAEL
jgi:glycerol kinase